MAKGDPVTTRSTVRMKFDKRRARLIEIAAGRFNEQGYDATSMRDIAAKVGILAGTIYYYFPSKESLLVAVHEEGSRRISVSITAALAKASADPWDQLAAASAGYLDSMLGGDRDFAAVIVAEFPRRHSKTLRAKLLENRVETERHFRDIVNRLPLRRGVDRSLWRLGLMGQLAWTFVWYRKGKRKPAEIAQALVDHLRYGAEKK